MVTALDDLLTAVEFAAREFGRLGRANSQRQMVEAIAAFDHGCYLDLEAPETPGRLTDALQGCEPADFRLGHDLLKPATLILAALRAGAPREMLSDDDYEVHVPADTEPEGAPK